MTRFRRRGSAADREPGGTARSARRARDATAALTTGVVAALHSEARSARAFERCGWRIVCCGVGGRRAAVAAQALVDAGARRLLVWGSAGGLDPDLTPGSVVLPQVVIGPDGERREFDRLWRGTILEALPAGLPVCEAPVATVRAAAPDGAAKAGLRAATGAAAVDMETAAVAAVAAAAGVPCAAVRVVADPAAFELPGVVRRAADARHPALHVAAALARRPRDLPATLRLAGAYRRARARLEFVARALVTHHRITPRG